MRNQLLKYFFMLMFVFYFTGCSSGPYDLNETDVKQEEKTITADTVKTVTKISEKTDEVKEESFYYMVQVGAFYVTFNFERFYETAKQKLGSEVYYEMINNLYKIRLGKFNNKAEALQLLSFVKSLGYDDAFIITVRNK